MKHRPRASRSHLVVVALLAAGCFSACTAENPPPERPNIVLISVDSLRADHLGCYGYERPTSPTIDRLAAEGALFEFASSSSSWTLPAHAALFTGLPDFVHGVDRGTRQLIPDRRTLPEALQAAGYRTVGIWSGPLLDPRFGFAQGFDEYWSHAAEEEGTTGAERGAEAWDRSMTLSHEDVTGPKILDKVDRVLDRASSEPFFLFVHLWDVHYDFIPPEPFDTLFTDPDYRGEVDGNDLAALLKRKREDLTDRDLEHLIALYDGEIAWTDQQIGEIVQRLEELGVDDRTLVVVTADHGEEFFDHGAFGHKRTLFDESIRVPLVMRYPGRIAAGQRVEEPVRIVDIAPTILEYAGAEPLPEVMGRSLVPALEGRPFRSEPAVSELVKNPQTHEILLSLRTPQWKIITRLHDGTVVGLYDLEKDPREQNDLYRVDPELTARAEAALETTLARLERLRARHARPQLGSGRLAPDLEAQLRSLGYIDGAAVEAGPAIWADPNPIQVCDGSGLGSTTVSWNAPEAFGPMDVRVGAPDGTLFATQDIIGSKTTKSWVQDGMIFVLVDTHTGEEVGRTRVEVTDSGCPGT